MATAYYSKAHSIHQLLLSLFPLLYSEFNKRGLWWTIMLKAGLTRCQLILTTQQGLPILNVNYPPPHLLLTLRGTTLLFLWSLLCPWLPELCLARSRFSIKLPCNNSLLQAGDTDFSG